MSKSKNDYDSNSADIIYFLESALHCIAGEHSGIPKCCIDAFLDGRTYMNLRNSLPEKQQKKLEKWNYVPCDTCFKNENIHKLKMNGISDVGDMLITLINITKNRRQEHARKSNKKSKG